ASRPAEPSLASTIGRHAAARRVNASCARWRARKAASPGADIVALSRFDFPFARGVPIKRDAPSVTAARPSMAKTVYVLNGPTPNPLGTREPQTYGRATLKDVEKLCREAAGRHKLAVEFRQSNHEGEIVDLIHEAAASKAAGIIINAGAYTHTSVAIRDAVAAGARPRVEGRASNNFLRATFVPHF